jgi:hypothetical protein
MNRVSFANLSALVVLIFLWAHHSPLYAQKRPSKVHKRFCKLNEKWNHESVIPFGWYNQRHAFFQGLKFELIDKSSHPYPLLDSLFKQVEEEVLILKFVNDTSLALCQTKLKSKKKRISAQFMSKELENLIDSTKKERDRTRFEFDSLCKYFEIKKWLLSEYADSLSPIIEDLSDSLMLQGRIIADQLQRTLALHPDKKSDGYRNRYKFISEMQAAHKVYGQTLTQLENSQTRFYDANPEEFFYTGPSIGKRREVEATEQVIQKLWVMMSDFRVLLAKIPEGD